MSRESPRTAKRSSCVAPRVTLRLLGGTSGARGRGGRAGKGAGSAAAFGALFGRRKG